MIFLANLNLKTMFLKGVKDDEKISTLFLCAVLVSGGFYNHRSCGTTML